MDITLSKWQTQVWDDNHRYKVINAGRRAGKSYLVALKAIEFAVKNKNSVVWYISPTYRQSKEIMWEMILHLCPTAAIKSKNSVELTVKLKNNSVIKLKGADNPDSLRGVKIDLAIFDEVAFFARWDDSWKVIRPTLLDSKADVWFISTPNGFNHFKELADKQHKDYKYFHFTTYDNPHIDYQEIETAKAEMDEDSFAQEMMGEFRKMVGLIYKTFDREIHMVDLPEFKEGEWSFTRTIDFGFAHKTAVVYFAINLDGSQIYAFDGIYKSGLTTGELADAIKIKDSGRLIQNAVADSAQPLQIEELRRRGVGFTPVKKGPDSVKSGIAKVAELLKVRKDTGKPTLMISKHLSWIATEFETYRWIETKGTGFIQDKPFKHNDDAMDSIRYFAMDYKKEKPFVMNTDPGGVKPYIEGML